MRAEPYVGPTGRQMGVRESETKGPELGGKGCVEGVLWRSPSDALIMPTAAQVGVVTSGGADSARCP